MTKNEMIEILVNDFGYDKTDLNKEKKDKVKEFYDYQMLQNNVEVEPETEAVVESKPKSISDDDVEYYFTLLKNSDYKSLMNEKVIEFKLNTLSESQAKLYAKTKMLGELKASNFKILDSKKLKEIIIKKFK